MQTIPTRTRVREARAVVQSSDRLAASPSTAPAGPSLFCLSSCSLPVSQALSRTHPLSALCIPRCLISPTPPLHPRFLLSVFFFPRLGLISRLFVYLIPLWSIYTIARYIRILIPTAVAVVPHRRHVTYGQLGASLAVPLPRAARGHGSHARCRHDMPLASNTSPGHRGRRHGRSQEPPPGVSQLDGYRARRGG